MICGTCNEDVHPVQEMYGHGTKFVSKCPRIECGAPMAESKPTTVSPNIQEEILALMNERDSLARVQNRSNEERTNLAWLEGRIQRLQEIQSGAPPKTAPRLTPPIVVEIREPAPSGIVGGPALDFVSQARARLADIEEQLAGVDKLEREAKQLRAMIAAAEAV